MKNTEIDPYNPLFALLATEAPQTDPSELQGVLCGLLASDANASGPHILEVLGSHASLHGNWSKDAQTLVLALAEQVQQAYQGDSLDLHILLPGDDQSLVERVSALALWCEGFMVGFGTGTAGLKDADLSPSLQEAIADMVAISQVEAPENDNQEAALLFEQVLEHCRVSAILVFTELALRRRRASGVEDNNKPTRH